MAVDFDRIAAQAATVAQLYREVELSLIRRISRQLALGLDAPGWAQAKLDAIGPIRRAAELLVAALTFVVGGRLPELLDAAYRGGYGAALEEIADELSPVSGIGRAARAARAVVPNSPQIDALAASIVHDLRPLHHRITRDVLDQYRAVVAATTARVLAGAATRREASQAAWQALTDRGLTHFTDRAGRQWQLSTYVEMAVRTVTARAAMQGHIDALVADGIRLVQVSDHPQECVICRPWEGKILALYGPTGDLFERSDVDESSVAVHVAATLEEARAAGLHHPNCEHNITAYFPGLTPNRPGQPDPGGDEANQRQRYLERRIRAAKVREAAAITPEAQRAARARVRAEQARLREHLDAHPDLRRLRYREQIGAGNIPGDGTDPGGSIGPDVQPTLPGEPNPPRPPRPDVPDVPDPGRDTSRDPLPGQLELAPPDQPPADVVDLTTLTDDQLAERFGEVPDDDLEAIEAILAEMARRDSGTPEPERQVAPEPDLDNPDLGTDRLTRDIIDALTVHGDSPDDVVEMLRGDGIDETVARAYVAEVQDLIRHRAQTAADQAAAGRRAQRDAARARHAAIARADAIARFVSVVEEDIDKRAPLPVLLEHARAAAGDDPELVQFLAVLERLESQDGFDQALADLDQSLERLGIRALDRAGDVVPFEDGRHHPVGEHPADGTPVQVIRPGWVLEIDGDRVQLDRAVTRIATGDALDRYQRDRRVEELVARGWEYREAYAEAYDLDSDQLAREEKAAALNAQRRIDPETGRFVESVEQLLRRLYAEWVDSQFLRAEADTRGHLLNPAGRAAMVGPAGAKRPLTARDLFVGPLTVARKYASPELAEWWERNGGRRTYAEFRADLLGRASDLRAAARARERRGNNDRDFGL